MTSYARIQMQCKLINTGEYTTADYDLSHVSSASTVPRTSVDSTCTAGISTRRADVRRQSQFSCAYQSCATRRGRGVYGPCAANNQRIRAVSMMAACAAWIVFGRNIRHSAHLPVRLSHRDQKNPRSSLLLLPGRHHARSAKRNAIHI